MADGGKLLMQNQVKISIAYSYLPSLTGTKIERQIFLNILS